MKPSMKWPLWATLFCFLPFLFALISRRSFLMQSEAVLEAKFLGGLGLALIVWAVYGIVCAICASIYPSSKRCAATSDGARPLKVNCPKCGRRLRGATTKMLGDVGVCPKCKTEFPITEQQTPCT